MANQTHSVDSEITAHTEFLNSCVSTLSGKTVPVSQENVVKRFIRDCNTLVADMQECEIPKRADLDDYSDQRNSLEVRFFNLMEILP